MSLHKNHASQGCIVAFTLRPSSQCYQAYLSPTCSKHMLLLMWSVCCVTTVPVRPHNLSVIGAAGQAVGAGLPFYAGVAASGAQLAWQIAAVDLDSQADCLAKFGSNKWHGAALFSGIVLDRLLA